jgi:spore germination cell wall hydrolase CwlJ-like protein
MKHIILAIIVIASFVSMGNAQTSRELTATCLIREAGTYGECMASVMHVIANRSKSSTYDGFKSVITKPHQFCSIHKQDSMTIFMKAKNHPRWSEALRLVDLAKENNLPNTEANSATHFFNPKMASPKWAKSMTFVARIGNHDFYKE